MITIPNNPPFLLTVLGVPAVAILATAVLLTTDRTPEPTSISTPTAPAAPISHQASARPDGCVMFCEDTPKPSFNEGNCAEPPPGINIRLWNCEPIRTPQPKSKAKRVAEPVARGCVMFCDERPWGER